MTANVPNTLGNKRRTEIVLKELLNSGTDWFFRKRMCKAKVGPIPIIADNT